MRLAVLDVGSNAAHLHVVDARPGRPPRSVYRLKAPTLLADAVTADGSLSPEAVDRLVSAVAETVQASHRHAVADLIPLATATIRDATNVEEIRKRVREETGVELRSLSGEDEARVTFLAARRWLGRSAGPILLLDIGGASAEIAVGTGEQPSFAVSLPIGAARLTRTMLPNHPADPGDVAAVHAHVVSVVAPCAAEALRDASLSAASLSAASPSAASFDVSHAASPGTALPYALHAALPRAADALHTASPTAASSGTASSGTASCSTASCSTASSGAADALHAADALYAASPGVGDALHGADPLDAGPPGPARTLGTSKTFKQLARVAGSGGRLTLEGLRTWVPRLAAMRPEERAALPGVAATRSRQILAGAIVAAATMEVLDVPYLDVCPWALREGLLLRRITELSVGRSQR